MGRPKKSKSDRIMVDWDFAHFLRVEAAKQDKRVCQFTRDLARKKKYGIETFFK